MEDSRIIDLPLNDLIESLFKRKQGREKEDNEYIEIKKEVKQHIHDNLQNYNKMELLYIIRKYIFQEDDKNIDYIEIINKYSQNHLVNIDVLQKIKAFENKLTKDKIYRIEDISIKCIANELKLSEKQLSQLINVFYNKNFQILINEYRVNEAKEILVLQPEMPIKKIYPIVGYTSQCTFFQSFKKLTGDSPVNYRKKQLMIISKVHSLH